MNDAEASVAKASPAPVGRTAASTGLAVYYALVVTQAVSLIGSQVSQYAVGIAVYRATGHANRSRRILFDRPRDGRVFAAFFQVAMLMTPLAALITGPLADRVFEPARRQPVWRSVGWFVGAGPGAGMGLMFVVAGVLVLALSLAVYATPAVRRRSPRLCGGDRVGDRRTCGRFHLIRAHYAS